MLCPQQKSSNFLSTVTDDCEMKLITKKVVNFISNYVPNNVKFIDLTWFNQYDNTINFLDDSLIFAIDVADPPYYFEEKYQWIKKYQGRVIYVGPVIENMPCPTIPFFGWLRFRPQEVKSKITYEDFFVSFNRKPHLHRQQYFDSLKNHSNLLSKGYVSFFEDLSKHEISKLSLDKDIVKLQSLAQQIDEKQLYSGFEIVCETSATDYHIFITEKFNKCVASETPLLLLGDYKTLSCLKTYYGFTDFGPDDSYDNEVNYYTRLSKVLDIADNFYSYSLRKVFDNAKINADHLHNRFDDIHDGYVIKFLEKALKYVQRNLQ